MANDGIFNLWEELNMKIQWKKFGQSLKLEINLLPSELIQSIQFCKYEILGTKIEDCPCYAGLDEQLFYNAKYEMIPDTFTGKMWNGSLTLLAIMVNKFTKHRD